MRTKVLRTIPCAGCGHRVGAGAGRCPYCGRPPRLKRHGPAPATPIVARPVVCSRCGGRLQHRRGLFTRLLAGVGLRIRARGARRLVCSNCGHRERVR